MVGMKSPFRYLQPSFFAGLFDDPLLYVKVRPSGRGLLVDCGKLHQLAKRVIKSLNVVFVSHAHMDHFMGIAALTRSLHVSGRTVDLFGPPGIRERMEHHLASFDWNLAEPWWGNWRVAEFDGTRLERSLFRGCRGFAGEAAAPVAAGDLLYSDDWVEVRGALFDHKLPVLGVRIDERPGFSIDSERLAAAGLSAGPWLEQLRRALRGEEPIISLRARRADGGEAQVDDPVALYRRISRQGSPAAIGYLTDVGMDDDNLARIRDFFRGVSLLVCECPFLSAEKAQARRSRHLCSEDFNRLLDWLRPQLALPMHLSKTYLRRSADLYRELEPPPGTRLLRLPDYRSPRPLLADELPLLA